MPDINNRAAPRFMSPIHPPQPFAAAPTNDRFREMVPLV